MLAEGVHRWDTGILRATLGASVATPPDTARRDEAPRIVGEKYRLIRALGSGGMGTVYEAEHTWTTRRVALKVIHPEYSRDEVAARRFLQEAKNPTLIAHPNIVEVLDMGRDATDGNLYIVHELMNGSDLHARLAQGGALPLEEVLDVMVPIMGALVAAGRRGIIHRDIKPENIFLSRSPAGNIVPKLIDFGISKDVATAAAPGPSLTRTGSPIGTPQYMSPEQVRGDIVLDERTDVWSVGVVIWELLTGRSLFEAPTFTLLAMKIMTEDAPRLDRFATHVPAPLVEVVHDALQRDRTKRHSTMRAFLAALLDSTRSTGPSLHSEALVARHADSLRTFSGEVDEPPPVRAIAHDTLQDGIAGTARHSSGVSFRDRSGEQPPGAAAAEGAAAAPVSDAARTPVPVPVAVRGTLGFARSQRRTIAAIVGVGVVALAGALGVVIARSTRRSAGVERGTVPVTVPVAAQTMLPVAPTVVPVVPAAVANPPTVGSAGAVAIEPTTSRSGISARTGNRRSAATAPNTRRGAPNDGLRPATSWPGGARRRPR